MATPRAPGGRGKQRFARRAGVWRASRVTMVSAPMRMRTCGLAAGGVAGSGASDGRAGRRLAGAARGGVGAGGCGCCGAGLAAFVGVAGWWRAAGCRVAGSGSARRESGSGAGVAGWGCAGSGVAGGCSFSRCAVAARRSGSAGRGGAFGVGAAVRGLTGAAARKPVSTTREVIGAGGFAGWRVCVGCAGGGRFGPKGRAAGAGVSLPPRHLWHALGGVVAAGWWRSLVPICGLAAGSPFRRCGGRGGFGRRRGRRVAPCRGRG